MTTAGVVAIVSALVLAGGVVALFVAAALEMRRPGRPGTPGAVVWGAALAMTLGVWGLCAALFLAWTARP